MEILTRTTPKAATGENRTSAYVGDVGSENLRGSGAPLGLGDFDDLLALLLVAGLAWTPFWLGGDRPLPWGVNAVFFPALALLYEAGLIVRGRRHPYALKTVTVPVTLFALTVGWVFVQVSPYVPSTLAHPIWGLASDGLGLSLPATISVDPSLSLLALTRLLTDASVLWLALQLGRDSERCFFLLRAIAIIVAGYAAYGIVLAAFFGGAIPGFDTPAVSGAIRSTFVNRNSFATYAGLGLVATIGLILRLHRHAAPDAEGLTSFRLNKLIEATGSRGVLWIGAGLLTLVALLGSLSRGGVFSAAFGVFALLALSTTRRRRRRGEQIETLVFVGVALSAGFLAFGDKIVGRIAESGLADASRLSVDLIVFRAIWDAPLLGFGYGAFADVFPMYRDQSISPIGVWDMAHNTYLEVWVGLGFVFGSALIASLIWLAVKCLLGALRRRRNATAPIVATAASLLVGVHALVDFSLQMEAVAVTYMTLLGLGLAQAESSRQAVSD